VTPRTVLNSYLVHGLFWLAVGLTIGCATRIAVLERHYEDGHVERTVLYDDGTITEEE